MRQKKILLIDGHPSENSLCALLSLEYIKGAKEGNQEIKELILRDLKFDPILRYGLSKEFNQELEEDLVKSQEFIKDCQHLVIVSPMWWGSVPALLKGFFDRVLLGGFAYRFNPKTGMPIKLLKGRTASVIYTQGAPKFISFLIGDTFWPMIKSQVLGFCGFSNIKRYQIGSAKNISDERMKRILLKVYEMGKKGE